MGVLNIVRLLKVTGFCFVGLGGLSGKKNSFFLLSDS